MPAPRASFPAKNILPNRFLIFLIFPSFIFLMMACAGPYTAEDDGKQVELSVNTSFQIVLEGEARSEFEWRLEEPISFAKLESTSKNVAGDDILEYTFNFKTTAQGQETLLLEYANGSEVKKNYKLRIVVGTLGPVLENK